MCSSECTVERCDWRTEGAVTGPKNQKNCSVCWDFAATAVLEGFYARSTGQNAEEFSQQFLMDCGHIYKRHLGTCLKQPGKLEGGDIIDAFQVTKKIGIPNLTTYEWAGKDKTCPKISESDLFLKGSKFFPRKKFAVRIAELKKIIRENGPVAVLMNPNNEWEDFKGEGIFNVPCDGTARNLGHAVSILDYVDVGGNSYWIVKNSWGELFGDNGIIKMQMRNDDYDCGIKREVYYISATACLDDANFCTPKFPTSRNPEFMPASK